MEINCYIYMRILLKTLLTNVYEYPVQTENVIDMYLRY